MLCRSSVLLHVKEQSRILENTKILALADKYSGKMFAANILPTGGNYSSNRLHSLILQFYNTVEKSLFPSLYMTLRLYLLFETFLDGTAWYIVSNTISRCA